MPTLTVHEYNILSRNLKGFFIILVLKPIPILNLCVWNVFLKTFSYLKLISKEDQRTDVCVNKSYSIQYMTI
jgi:hypothetical protein